MASSALLPWDVLSLIIYGSTTLLSYINSQIKFNFQELILNYFCDGDEEGILALSSFLRIFPEGDFGMVCAKYTLCSFL